MREREKKKNRAAIDCIKKGRGDDERKIRRCIDAIDRVNECNKATFSIDWRGVHSISSDTDRLLC